MLSLASLSISWGSRSSSSGRCGSSPAAPSTDRTSASSRSFEADRRIVEVTLELPHGARAEEIVGTVGELEGVRAVRWSP